jgi:acetylornithine/succinyldiaminopimelate/putrescine aminotransferase
MRNYNLRHPGPRRCIFVTSTFAGNTLAMTAATGQSKFQEPYIPLPDGFFKRKLR